MPRNIFGQTRDSLQPKLVDALFDLRQAFILAFENAKRTHFDGKRRTQFNVS